MAEKVQFGNNRNSAIVRTPVLKITVERWDWVNGRPKDKNPIDITPYVIEFRWEKTIKSPASNCTLVTLPQTPSMHFLDYFSPMDVINIEEFNVLKYSGFIRSIKGTGFIAPDGKPKRFVTIAAASFGSLIVEGHLGANLFEISNTFNPVAAALLQFGQKLTDILKTGGATYSKMVYELTQEWFNLLNDIITGAGGTIQYQTYINNHMDFSTGVSGSLIPGEPKEFQFFYATDQNFSLFDVLQKICEFPFNELWFDVGPRRVSIDGQIVYLSSNKTNMVLRTTPFNGSKMDGADQSAFDNLETKVIPIGYLTRFDFEKSMEEMYDLYIAHPAIWNLNDNQLIAQADFALDTDAFNKYLLRLLTKEMMYERVGSIKSSSPDPQSGTLDQTLRNAALTLQNWFSKNDQYLSGVLTIEVPSQARYDPLIGEKIAVEGIDDAYFYVEGVSHSWTYGGKLEANLSITRGYGINSPIILKDKIFKRGRFALNNDDAGWK